MNQNQRFGKGLPTVLCECGEEILVIPDLREMVRCIEAHAIFHEKKETDPKKARDEHIRIEEQLARKIVIKIAYMPNKDV
jgi:SpoU rRNA methylase family enzyme